MPVLQFRSPQQGDFTNAIYQTLIRHYGLAGNEAPRRSLLEDRGVIDGVHPALIMLQAPTGWGKTNVSMEPLAWLTSCMSPHDGSDQRHMPATLEQIADALQMDMEKFSPEEILKVAAEKIRMACAEVFENSAEGDSSVAFRTPEERGRVRELIKGLDGFVGQGGGQMPVNLDDGGVAIFVKTRSQTQAFLRESRQKNLNAIALPSKASVCMNGRVQRQDSEPELTVYGSDVPSVNSLMREYPSELDGTNPTEARTPYDPSGKNAAVARLHSHACDQCSICPLNLNLQKRLHHRLMNDPEDYLEGAIAEDYVIFSTDRTEPEDYMKEVVAAQQETMDLEESTARMWEKHPTICPYPTIRNSLPEFDVAILTYPYMFNRDVSVSLSDYLDHFRHAVIDEAHNISGLYQQLTTNVYPGNGPGTDKLSSELFNFDVLEEGPVDTLEKEMSKGLFGTEYEKRLQIEVLKLKEEGLSSEYARKQAMKNLEDEGILDPNEVIAQYRKLAVHVKSLAVWLAIVQHRYIGYYTKLVNKVGENNIKSGIEPEAVDLMNMLFGPVDMTRKLDGETNEEGQAYYFTYLANTPAGAKLREGVKSVSNVLYHYVQMREHFFFTEYFEKVKKAKNSNLKSIGRVSAAVTKLMVSHVQDVLALCHSLVAVYPEQMSHWFLENQVTVPAIEVGFIDSNGYIFDAENTKKYFLHDQYDWTKVMQKLYSGISLLKRLQADFTDNVSKDEFDDRTVYLMDWAMDVENRPKRGDYGAKIELMEKILDNINTANKSFQGIPQVVFDELDKLGITIPKFRYEGVFPSTNWKVYYRYWDGYFEVTPLTIGPLLASQFSKYKSVSMVSGTFPPLQYIQAFWGIDPYQFQVTEKIGKMDFCLVRGVSSKYQERESSYGPWAQLIMDVYDRRVGNCQKSLLVGFPSREVMNTVAEKLATVWDEDLFWYPTEEAGDVNDMIDELNRCAEAGVRKAFLVPMGSRFTEGVEYVDVEKNSMLDAVIACGIPYPGLDIHLDNMKLYAQELFQMDQWEAFHLINTEMAYQKVRQLAGRGVRSDRDSVMVYLADSRYGDRNWQPRMPYQYAIDAPVFTDPEIPF